MYIILLKLFQCGQFLVTALIIGSGHAQASRFENDTVPLVRIVTVDSIPKPVFEPLVVNGKDAAAGSVMFGGLAIGLNVVSVISSSMGPAMFAHISSIIALVLAGVSVRLSRKRKGKIPFISLKEYRAVRKKAGIGAILGSIAFIIAIICMAAFLTLNITL